MENLTDAQLVKLYLEGNSKAFDGLVSRYGKTLYRFAYSIFGTPEDAHDCTQESFVKAWKHIKKYDSSKSFKTWLFTITRRTALDMLRKKKTVNFSKIEDAEDVSLSETIPDENLLPNEVFEQNEGITIISELLKSLPYEPRTILLLHHAEEMTFEEISDVLEKPMNTIKSIYRRTLIKLREQLVHQNYKP